MKRILMLLLLIPLVGCIYLGKLPSIDNHHWKLTPFGAELYNKNGIESASFTVKHFGEPAQVCDFDDTHPLSSCMYFETNEDALKWLKNRFN